MAQMAHALNKGGALAQACAERSQGPPRPCCRCWHARGLQAQLQGQCLARAWLWVSRAPRSCTEHGDRGWRQRAAPCWKRSACGTARRERLVRCPGLGDQPPFADPTHQLPRCCFCRRPRPAAAALLRVWWPSPAARPRPGLPPSWPAPLLHLESPSYLSFRPEGRSATGQARGPRASDLGMESLLPLVLWCALSLSTG